MRKSIFALVTVSVILAAVQAQAALVNFMVVANSANTGWQVWATDWSQDNNGIQALAFTLTGVTGTPLYRLPSIVLDNGDVADFGKDTVGFIGQSISVVSHAANFTIAEPNSVVFDPNEFLMGVGQNAGNLHNYYSTLGDPNAPGDGGTAGPYNQGAISSTMPGDTTPTGIFGLAGNATLGSGSSTTTNPFGGVGIEVASGNDNVAGTLPTISSYGANVYTSVPTDTSPSGVTTSATVAIGVPTVSPEPATLALLAFGGLLVLPRRRRQA